MSDHQPLCHRVRESLPAYLDGELKAGARRLIDEHLAECPECRAHLKELKETWSLLDELEAPIVPRQFADEVWSRIEEEEKVGPLGRLERWTGASGLLAGLAASIAAAVFLFGLYTSSKPLSDLPTPAEREAILYMDVLVDLETIEQLEMVRHVERLGQQLDVPAESAPETGGEGSGV